jgi:hypothetical protein
MSNENVELVRRYLESLDALLDQSEDPAHRDLFKLPSFALHMEEFWHPKVVFDVSGRPDGGIYHGRDGVIQASLDWLQAWEEYDIEFKEILPVGDQVVLVHMPIRGKGKGGPEVELNDLYVALTVRDGRFVHYKEYPTRAEALEATGLSEQDPHADS